MKKGTFVFNVSDLFNSRKWRSTNFNPNKENPTSINYQESQWRVRQVSLNFTYRFNQKKESRSEKEEAVKITRVVRVLVDTYKLIR